MLILCGLIGFSLIFFSRGILIFLTIICLAVITIPSFTDIAMQLRWVLFFLFCLHIFGDIFLGRTVRRIKFFDVLAIVFIIYALLSTFYSPYPRLTLERAITLLLLYISVFWIIWKYAYDRSPETVINLILQALAPVFIAGYLMIFVGPYRPFMLGRFTGVFGNPNNLGVMSSIVLPLILWKFLETRKKTALFLFLLTLLGLFLSCARGAMNATALSLGYFIFGRSKKLRPLLFFSFVSFTLIMAWVIESMIKVYFMSYIRVKTIPILGGRLEIWPMAMNLIMDKPIFGYGFGEEDKLIEFKHLPVVQHYGRYMHNSYLGMLVQLGILGLIIFFVPLFILLFKELFLRRGSEAPLLRHALLASLIAGLICCVYESFIYSVGNPNVLILWIIIMLLTFYRYQDKAKNMPEGT